MPVARECQASANVESPSRWVQPRGVAPLVVVIAAVMLTASSCGASDKAAKQLLRSDNPVTSDLYVQLKGPAGAVTKIANGIETGAFTTIKAGAVPPYGTGGSFVPPNLQRHRVCLFTRTIQPVDSPELQPWLGQKITFTVYGGKSSPSVLYCRLLGALTLPAG